ncbi:MAG: hypothetical protein RLZZ511_1419 [Cyanobacteriota bacterium]|jgi:hypothetical protein
MLKPMLRRLQSLVTFALKLGLSLGLIWLQQPIVAIAQTPPKPALLQQATDNSAPQPMTEAELAKLKDPMFQLVLKNNADVKTLSAVNQLLKPTKQSVFVVDEQIADGAPKVGNNLANRRAIVTLEGTTNGQTLDQNVLFSVSFDSEKFPTANFIEVMGWDESSGSFNYYKFNQTKGETAPTWKFRGNSKDADILSTTARQATCMQCHINGGPVMKELVLPWNNWDSFSDKISYLSPGGKSWPIANAANSPLKNLEGAETLETGVIMPGITRFNTRRINQLKSTDGKMVTDARRLLKPLFITTEANLISSTALSSLHPLAKRSSLSEFDIPPTFFVNQSLLDRLSITVPFFEFNGISGKDYEQLVRQTKTTLNGQQPGDNNFAWFVPEAGFIDSDFVSQLLDQEIVPPAFVAAAVAIDLENPVFSASRAKLWSDKILPAQFKAGANGDLIPQVVKNLEALNPAAGTPEALFLQRLKSPTTAVASLKTQVDQYVNRERTRLGINAKPKDRSQELIRLYKLMLQRREAMLKDANLKSLDETGGKLLFARGDVAATVSRLPSTIKTSPTLRLGAKGKDVIALQELLRDFGAFSGSIDGDFGPMTEKAVMAAQTKLKLTADGVVGVQTWTALQVNGV